MVDIFEDYDSIDIPMHHIAILMRYLNKNAQYKMQEKKKTLSFPIPDKYATDFYLSLVANGKSVINDVIYSESFCISKTFAKSITY